MRVLVTYASKNGSTEEIAEAIADELMAYGLDVECGSAHDADASDVDAVILGSAVYADRWLRPARRFLKEESDRLRGIPFWIFSSGPFGEQATSPTDDDLRWQEPPRVLSRAEALGVREHVVFGGRLPTEPHGFIENAMVRNTPDDARDARDWSAIRTWAASIAHELGAKERIGRPIVST
ncbi:menaquinone-dependent protoporphyrinogen oxidase [Microbacterium sp. AK009]|uniref:flavodoxin domain-containing protein n=1 Tax=Microbacterium sp. AK009 TaxID=2723068 RepID=UPI0015CA0217|nr:flavodoxin domain-containing protein [Microbacterium sp. AK009]NYF16904.1 menaquinone-dependent protoporphyrinogen oxidase [Microbacterium sp. AK009]